MRAPTGGDFNSRVRYDPAAGTESVPTVNPANYPTDTLPTPPGGTPPRVNWYAPPAQIGDNLYWLGTRNHSTYALVNKKGGETILIDGNFEYATEDEIHNGLKYLGLNINKVKYSIYGHAHGDHDGGAHLTEAAIPGVTIVYGKGDWPSVLARTVPHATRSGPENDGTDSRVITLGDMSVKIVTYPGHTPGTISFLFEYMDGGKPVKAAYVGGTLFSFIGDCRVLRPVHRLGQEVRSEGSGLRRHSADDESPRVRPCLLQGARGGEPSPQEQPRDAGGAVIRPIHIRRSTADAELLGYAGALRHGRQAPGDRQPLDWRLSGWDPSHWAGGLPPAPFSPGGSTALGQAGLFFTIDQVWAELLGPVMCSWPDTNLSFGKS